MTGEEILQLAKNHLIFERHNNIWKTDTLQLLKFARAIIEEHEKDRKHNLGEDEYFNSWRN
jgi:hypothetical protein